MLSRSILSLASLAGLVLAIAPLFLPNPILATPSPPVLLAQRSGRVPPPRTSRSGLCVVSPGLLEDNFVIWSDRPLFLWQFEGDGTQLQMKRLRLFDSNPDPNRRRILWETALPPTGQALAYTGPVLQPGQNYYWELQFQRQNPGSTTWEEVTVDSAFQVMDTTQRNQIATELQRAVQQGQSSGGDREAIAHRQADYFSDKALWSDALAVLYGVPNPSTMTTGRVEELVRAVCNPG